jgi:hypothetical protein
LWPHNFQPRRATVDTKQNKYNTHTITMASFQETNRHNNKNTKNEHLGRGGTIKRTNNEHESSNLYEPSTCYKASTRNLTVSDDYLYKPSDSYNAAVRGLSCRHTRSSMSSTATTASTTSTTTESGNFFKEMLDNFPYDDENERCYMSR